LAIKKNKKIGEITHFFGKIKVGIVKMTGILKVGDSIRILGGETDFDQSVQSIEIDGKKIKKTKKGDLVGLKFSLNVPLGILTVVKLYANLKLFSESTPSVTCGTSVSITFKDGSVFQKGRL